MNVHLAETAQKCLEGAENNTMTFPQIVETLMHAGCESYAIDFRLGKATYYTSDGDSVVLQTHRASGPIAAALNVAGVEAAIREAQHLVPGYTYAGFCTKVMAAGCVGYFVSFIGRRAVYLGRAADVHVEHFPK